MDQLNNHEEVLAFPARINCRAAAILTDAERLRRLAEERAWDPTIFADSAPYFWPATASTDRVDSYSSIMMPSSLKNYAADADAGVSFQNSHDHKELPLGSSLVGKYTGQQAGEGVARFDAAFYTIPGLQLGKTSTDNFIRGVRAGIVRDVSIGFYGGHSQCSICGADDMWSPDSGCWHWPGVEYELTNKDGEVVDRAVCIERINDAHLAEVSGVYDGACPGAMIWADSSRGQSALSDRCHCDHCNRIAPAFGKALTSIDAGTLEPRQARLLESRYRIKLPNAREIHALGGGGREMADQPTPTPTPAPDPTPAPPPPAPPEPPPAPAPAPEPTPAPAPVEMANEPAPAPPPAPAPAPVVPEPAPAPAPGTAGTAARFDRRVLSIGVIDESTRSAINAELDRLTAEVSRLSRAADDGATYRTDLIDEAVKEGIRAQGNTFPAETYKATLKEQPLANIKQIRDAFKAQGDARFAGGRSSHDEEPPTERETVSFKPPAAAFMG